MVINACNIGEDIYRLSFDNIISNKRVATFCLPILYFDVAGNRLPLIHAVFDPRLLVEIVFYFLKFSYTLLKYKKKTLIDTSGLKCAKIC